MYFSIYYGKNSCNPRNKISEIFKSPYSRYNTVNGAMSENHMVNATYLLICAKKAVLIVSLYISVSSRLNQK